MNWYKIVKISYPEVSEGYVKPGYLDVGHSFGTVEEAERNYLWFIDDNFDISVINENELYNKETKKDGIFSHQFSSHSDWGKYKKSNVIAKGRAQNIEGNIIVSANIISVMMPRTGLFAERRYRKIIENILDTTFNNPRIIFY